MSKMQNNAPILSVIMPVYNSEDYLEEAIESILLQDFTDFELIIIDDGSTDKSLDIIESYLKRDSRIKFFTTNHEGAGPARNVGIANARGFYTLFADADDVYDYHMISSMYSKAVYTNADVVICAYRKFDNITGDSLWDFRPKDIFLKKDRIYASEYSEILFMAVPPSPWGKLIKSSVIKENAIHFQNLTSCNDVAFSYSLLSYAKILAFVNTILLFYRANTGKNISKDRSSQAENIFYALAELENRLKLNNTYNVLRKTFKWRAKSAIENEFKQCTDPRKKQLMAFAKKMNSEIITEIVSEYE